MGTRDILQGREWALENRTSANEMISDEYVRKLHLKMFDQTWKWAGKYRHTEKNIGVPFHQIRERLVALFGDVGYWIEHATLPPDEIAIRFHHRLVQIHPFPNGNGRHARLIADLFVKKLGLPPFTWGSTDLVKRSEARDKYLSAIRAADGGDIQPLSNSLVHDGREVKATSAALGCPKTRPPAQNSPEKTRLFGQSRVLGSPSRSTTRACESTAFRSSASAYCFTLSSTLASAGDGGSARPPRYFARKFSAAALKAMLFSGRAKPWPSSGKDVVLHRLLVLAHRGDDLVALRLLHARVVGALADQQRRFDLVAP